MRKLAVVALGGNALLKSGETGTYDQQLQNVQDTCDALMGLIDRDYDIVIGHGNGPQVGNVLLQHDAGKKLFSLEAMPMDFCVAETQGSIGYMIERTLTNSFRQKGMDRNVITLVTQVVVDKDDPAFRNPTKPIGPYYTGEQAAEMAKDGSVFREDPKGNGWRKVVASPAPLRVKNIDVAKMLAGEGNVVVTVGGGGIPVYDDGGMLRGVEAVIDKDLASALAAVQMGADKLFIITDVPNVYVNFRKAGEKALEDITVTEAERYMAEGQFSEGSMLPKVKAAIYFVKNGGKECVITSADNLGTRKSGTRIKCLA